MTDPSTLPGSPGEDGSMLGFSLSSPHLIICASSPDIQPKVSAFGFQSPSNRNKRSVNFSSICQTFHHDTSAGSSFRLLPPPSADSVSINAGCSDGSVLLGEVEFMEDDCFLGGDTVKTNAEICDGDGNLLSLYQTARFGNFSYCFRQLEAGNYVVALHLAEIVFINGPPGIRVFDVFIQHKKVVSCLDIYSQIGANKPLVISDFKACVDGGEGLSIRFEGVIGSPFVCGISVTKASSMNIGAAQCLNPVGLPQVDECKSLNDDDNCVVEGDYDKLLRHYEFQKSELVEMRRALDELKKENQHKDRKWQDALKSLNELQNELMRKSMHVGSLAFAIEGQVKEKSKWFSSMRDLTRKLKIMKMEHIKLSKEALECKDYLANMNEIRGTILSKLKQQEDLHKDLQVKCIEGAMERKELYNKVLELKGNIRVFCRCRPLKPEEVAAGTAMAIDFESAKDGELTVISNGHSRKAFKFDAVFGPQAGQADVYEDTAPLAISVLDGFNVCIFAYGQTGTGKTFTMEGTEDARGVNFRILEDMFRIIQERKNLFQYYISVSVLEVYNEQIRDLLASSSQPGAAAKRLEIRKVGEGMHHVPGLVDAQVNNTSEMWEVLKTGTNARAVGSTNANEHSSRSHCIHCVMVKGENLVTGECTRSKLWLVDLAGSERVAKTEVQGERLKETQHINRSLSALGDVISALATKSPHIPFRNSKLTHLLQDSLGGDSKTLMFLQISPNENDLGETLCSLNFASRVRGIELGPAKRQLDTTELLRCKQMAEKSKVELKSKDVQIKKMEETIHGLDMRIKEKDLKNKNLQEKVKELESQLLVERKLARQHVDTKIAEQHQQLQQTKQPLDELNIAPVRPPLAGRLLGSNKNSNEAAPSKELLPLTQPLIESSNYRPAFPFPSTSVTAKYIDPAEKENNHEVADQPRLLPKRTGRASICTAARRIPVASAPRRNSLIPISSAVQLAPELLPLPSCQGDEKQDTDILDTNSNNSVPKQTHCGSPVGIRKSNKKLSSILRRSLQKKIQMKSPLMQQQIRRGGINVGMEKVRVSIGNRGRLAHRVLLGNGRRAGMKTKQQKQVQLEKERGWNIRRTVGRTAI